ncbi:MULTISPECIES: monovalent cation/H(+) antiporter subunit G [Roseateles]|uniref:Multicomponent K+:H+ antiporter subunit G n=1 Tax=Pelomonas aquatica TaxID=431058 RepID=A0ABU1Z6J8_9BURK|nr:MULTISPECIES: monovalent cation/H(+) antiporter subunit G [Roseateles]KQY86487.1 cation:proton antiporter [Pelomonas sp. Root1444]MDR7295636.1 multicomponent K+:H+ antiporter subunit G [Pelomonas aquatica]
MSDLIVATLLLASGCLVLVAALGLWRLPDFFTRMHAPALASTLAAWLVAAGFVVHFSVHGSGLSLQVWAIIILLSITAPVTTLLLARAALFRRRQAGDAIPRPLADSERPAAAGVSGGGDR